MFWAIYLEIVTTEVPGGKTSLQVFFIHFWDYIWVIGETQVIRLPGLKMTQQTHNTSDTLVRFPEESSLLSVIADLVGLSEIIRELLCLSASVSGLKLLMKSSCREGGRS